MGTLQEIEKAIEQLPREQISRLREVIQHRFDDAWDRQFADDAESGMLDEIASEALEMHQAGKSRPFPQNEK